MKPAIAVALPFLLVACAPAPDGVTGYKTAPKLPTAQEVTDFVTTHWDEDYRMRFGRFASRPQESARLVSIANVACRYHYLTVTCTFEATAKFGDEAERTLPMSDEFDRDDRGMLESVFVIYEVRRK